MLRVGLTGGIGCGKSTVAAMMRELGCRVLDADLLARELIEPSELAFEEIVSALARKLSLPMAGSTGHASRAPFSPIRPN